ncbi:MAG: hypothetical protein LBR92_04105 [Puniceicoccales bacterium]|jgi:hypothetical protein|nr:hypothetical protein [Puniceicoccales bacterium]
MDSINDENSLRAMACNILTSGSQDIAEAGGVLNRIKAKSPQGEAWGMFNDTQLSTSLLVQMAGTFLNSRMSGISNSAEFEQQKKMF